MEEKETKLYAIKNLDDPAIEKVLSGIEFPGQDRSEIEAYLKKANIPETIIQKIAAMEERKHRIKIWMIIALCAFTLLLVLGANQYVTEFLVFFQGAILLFIAVALSAICLTGIIGVIMNIDRHRIEEGFRLSGERVGQFFHKLFRM